MTKLVVVCQGECDAPMVFGVFETEEDAQAFIEIEDTCPNEHTIVKLWKVNND
jgi:hypothetical protein